MKARIYITAAKIEAVLENGVVLQSQDQDLTALKAQVEEVVDRDYADDVVCVEITLPKLRKRKSDELQKMLAAATSDLEKEMLLEVLNSRGIAFAPEAQEAQEAQEAPKKKAAPKKKVVVVEDSETNEVTPEANEAEAAPKVKEPKATLEDAEAAALLAKANVGKIASFLKFRTAIRIFGLVKGVVVDKRVAKAMYRLEVEGKIVHCSINAKDFRIEDEATAEYIAAKEAEAKQEAADRAAGLPTKSKKAASPKLTADEAALALDLARTNKGKVCNFSPFRSKGKLETGIINGATLDKRVNRVMYRIELADGSMVHCSMDAENFSIDEEATAALAAEKEAAREAARKVIEDTKQAKLDNAAQSAADAIG